MNRKCFLILACLIWAGCGKNAGPADGLKINYVEHSAYILSGTTASEAKPGDVVPANGRIEARGGSVDVGLDEGRAVRLLDGSAAEVAKNESDGGERHIDLRLTTGTVLAKFKPGQASPTHFRIITPSGVCGARGTGFFVKSDPAGMVVGVEEGQVQVKGTAGGEITVPAGKRAVATLTAPVTDIDNLLESDHAALSHLNWMNFDLVLTSTRKTVAAVDVKAIQAGLEMHRASNGRYPDTLNEAMDSSKDPWGNPFNYIPNETRDDYQISSSGPDGLVNTADDIRLK